MSYSSSTAAAQITKDQLRMLYALARENGMDDDTLHARAEAVTGQAHLSKLSKMEAARLIDSLLGKKVMYAKKQRATTRVTQGQVDVIFGLAIQLGWLTDGYERIRGFVKSRYGVEVIDWMTPDQGTKCIEALKAMLKGGRGERKNKGGEEHGAQADKPS